MFNLFKRNKHRFLKEGDKAPDSLLNKDDGVPMNGYVAVCPNCNRIDKIFIQ